MNDTGAGWYAFETGLLADVTEHRYRVVPVGVNGVDGVAKEMRGFLVRRPALEALAYSYDDGTQTVTISAG